MTKLIHLKSHVALAKPLLSLVVVANDELFSPKYHRIALFFVTFICVCTTSVLSAPAMNFNKSSSGCFQCRTLMQREWKPNMVPAECSGTKQDCGKCLEGYSAENNESPCKLSGEISIAKSGASVVQRDTAVTLTCLFDVDVDCAWSRRGFPVQIHTRYSYTKDHKGERTKDCSLKINHFSPDIDFGEWVCSSLADSTQLSVTSTVVHLVSGTVITVKEQDKKAVIPIGHDVIILCEFDEPAECAWSREKFHLEVRGRYHYVNTKNGQGTKDCSIKIDKFNSIDVGVWECQSMGDSNKLAIPKTSVKLYNVEEPSLIEGPWNTTIANKDKVILICKFNAEVECQWQLNGAKAPENRYEFLDMNMNLYRRDCSIEVNVPSLNEQQPESWTCSYRGFSSVSTGSNTAHIMPIRKPTPPEIIIGNSNRNKRSTEITTIHQNDVIYCHSINGRPAAILRWEINGVNLEATSQSKGGATVENATITLDISKNQEIKEGVQTLKCIAKHPAFQKDLVEERKVKIIKRNIEITSKETTHVTMNDNETFPTKEVDITKARLDWKIIMIPVGLLTALVFIGAVGFLIFKIRSIRRIRQERRDVPSKETKALKSNEK